MKTPQLLHLTIGLLFISIVPVVSCSGTTKREAPMSGSLLAATPPGDSADMKSLLTLSGAESILGEKGYLKNSSLSVKDDVSIFKATYVANSRDQKTGKTGGLYMMVEDYRELSSAVEVYTAIRKSNENHAGVEVLKNLGDEAYYHTDGKNFAFILARKGGKVLRLKINKITSHTSLDEFNRIARDMVASL